MVRRPLKLLFYFAILGLFDSGLRAGSSDYPNYGRGGRGDGAPGAPSSAGQQPQATQQRLSSTTRQPRRHQSAGEPPLTRRHGARVPDDRVGWTPPQATALSEGKQRLCLSCNRVMPKATFYAWPHRWYSDCCKPPEPGQVPVSPPGLASRRRLAASYTGARRSPARALPLDAEPDSTPPPPTPPPAASPPPEPAQSDPETLPDEQRGADNPEGYVGLLVNKTFGRHGDFFGQVCPGCYPPAPRMRHPSVVP